MGCHQIKNEEPKAQCVFTEKQYLQYMLEYIEKDDRLGLVLDGALFGEVKKWLDDMCWPYESKAELARLLEDYIRFSIQETFDTERKYTKFTLDEIGRQFGEEVYHIKSAVQKKNMAIQQTLQLYMVLNSLMFPLSVSNESQITKLRFTIEKINSLAQRCEETYFYLSLLLVKACREMEKNGCSMKQINTKLEQVTAFINNDFINTPETEFAQHHIMLYHELREKQYDRHPSQIFNKNYKYRTLNLKDCENREEAFQNQIMDVVEESKKEFQYFERMMHNIVKFYDGCKFKVNFKLKYREDIESLDRIKEKILFKQGRRPPKDTELDYESINELREEEKRKRHEQVNEILEEKDEINLEISDMLRGKCVFKIIQDVNNVAEQIFRKVKKEQEKGIDIEVLELENRLKKITNDIVMKIRIRKTITQFQIAFSSDIKDTFGNETYHKVYEISRSKMMSSISMLFNWHEKLAMTYIKFLSKVVKHPKIKTTPEQQNQFERLKRDPDVAYLLSIQAINSDKIALKSDIVTVLLVDKIIDDNKVETVKEDTQERTAEFFINVHEYEKALFYANKALKQHEKNETKKAKIQRRISEIIEKLEPQRHARAKTHKAVSLQ